MNWKRALLGAILVSIALGRPARSDQITNLQLYDGSSSPIVNVTYSNPDGSGSITQSVYADPQVSSGTTAPIYYCVNLWHDNYLGSTYTITPVSSLSYATSTFSDVDNRIAWLMNQSQASPDERAAVQLAMWYTIDNVKTSSFSGFSFTGGDTALVNDYNQLIGFTGYNPTAGYDAQFWAATHDSSNTLYQDLVSAGGGVHTSSVPEPSGVVLAFIGMFSAFGFYWRRGRRVRPTRD